MRAPVLKATIERRLLVNYRIDPDALAAVLPAPFEPALVNGFGMGGICLIRLGGIRPARLPRRAGLTTENAAHRVAVAGGVYIPRRDTSSRVVALLGGRAFPGWHHRATFDVDERPGRYEVGMRSRDGEVSVTVRAHLSDAVMAGSVFATLEEASQFFQCAPVGYAATPEPGVYDSVQLSTCGWGMTPLAIEHVASSFFDDPDRFPPGAATVDSAFLMRGLESTWTPQPRLTAGVA